jgi:hypothetical protein
MNLTAIQIKKGDMIFADSEWHKVERIVRKENHRTWGDIIYFNDLHPIFTFMPIQCKRVLEIDTVNQPDR